MERTLVLGGGFGSIEGDFYAEPEPSVRVGDVSAAHHDEKVAFEREHLARWFGRWSSGDGSVEQLRLEDVPEDLATSRVPSLTRTETP